MTSEEARSVLKEHRLKLVACREEVQALLGGIEEDSAILPQHMEAVLEAYARAEESRVACTLIRDDTWTRDLVRGFAKLQDHFVRIRAADKPLGAEERLLVSAVSTLLEHHVSVPQELVTFFRALLFSEAIAPPLRLAGAERRKELGETRQAAETALSDIEERSQHVVTVMQHLFYMSFWVPGDMLEIVDKVLRGKRTDRAQVRDLAELASLRCSGMEELRCDIAEATEERRNIYYNFAI